MILVFVRTLCLITCSLALLTPVLVHAQEAKPDLNPWCDPAQIDPYASDVSDYLAVDLMALTSAAQVAYDAGDYQAAAKYYLAITRCDVHDVIAMYDLACCYAYLDKPELCATYLRSSVERGFENLERIQKEKAFDVVRSTKVFNEALESLSGEIESRRATKRFYYATARFDETDPSSIYELACCYALRDDARMAAEYLVKAFQAGYQAFDQVESNHEFDSVRDSSEFVEAVDAIHEMQTDVEVYIEPADLGIPPDTLYCDAEVALPCLIQFPKDYDPDREYPMVIGLHGYGGNVERFASLWFAMDDPQFIFAVPEAPYLVPQQQYLGYSWWVWDYENKPLWDRTVDHARTFTRKLTEQLKDQYNVSEIYLFGFSQGTALTYSVGINEYPVYTGIISVGGWLDETWFDDGAVERATGLRTYIAHAEDDQSMRFTAAEQARDYLTTAGYDVQFASYQGGHTLTEELIKQIEGWVESE